MKTQLLFSSSKPYALVISCAALAAPFTGPSVWAQQDPATSRSHSHSANQGNAPTGPAATIDRSTAPEARTQTPQEFAHSAAVANQLEIRLGQLAGVRAQNPQVKRFAQQMVNDHYRANQQLRQIAARKGLVLPQTNAFASTQRSPRAAILAPPTSTGAERDGEVSKGPRRSGRAGTTKDTQLGTPGTAADASAADPADRSYVRDRDPSPADPSSGGSAARGPLWVQIPPDKLQMVERVEPLSGAAFDQAYMGLMVQNHAETLRKFEQAALHVADADLKRFADAQLPKLREHFRMAQIVNKSVAGSTGIAPRTEAAPSHQEPQNDRGRPQSGQSGQSGE